MTTQAMRVTVAEIFRDTGTVSIRQSRKQHHCAGGYDRAAGRRIECQFGALIKPGSIYVEYTGETPPFQSGPRYHLECAEQQGLVALS